MKQIIHFFFFKWHGKTENIVYCPYCVWLSIKGGIEKKENICHSGFIFYFSKQGQNWCFIKEMNVPLRNDNELG
jgi:phage pi2 protein 07